MKKRTAIGPTVLLVEDEEDIRELLMVHLKREGFDIVEASDGLDGLEAAASMNPALILLDLMLPRLDGREVCRRLKSDPVTRGIPVIMLTARDNDADIVTGLELGADDYITKPFSPAVLIARVRSVLRRWRNSPDRVDSPLMHGPLRIDPGRYEVTVGGQPVDLTFSEFAIILALATSPGKVFSRKHIVEAIHGESYPVTDRAVDVHITGLRKKLGTEGRRIETVRGVGYRFRGES